MPTVRIYEVSGGQELLLGTFNHLVEATIRTYERMPNIYRVERLPEPETGPQEPQAVDPAPRPAYSLEDDFGVNEAERRADPTTVWLNEATRIVRRDSQGRFTRSAQQNSLTKSVDKSRCKGYAKWASQHIPLHKT